MSKLPKWFNGTAYKQGDTVTNPFSGESYELNADLLSMYDYIMGAQLAMEMGMHHDSMIKDFQKGLDWFRKQDARAYMVLLD